MILAGCQATANSSRLSNRAAELRQQAADLSADLAALADKYPDAALAAQKAEQLARGAGELEDGLHTLTVRLKLSLGALENDAENGKGP